MTTPWRSPVLVATAVLGLGVAGPACDAGGVEGSADAEGAAPVPAADLATVEYDVAGMTCGGCALAAEVAVGRLDGVAEVEAAYEDGAGSARVTYDPARVDPARIAAVIEDLGYSTTPRPGS